MCFGRGKRKESENEGKKGRRERKKGEGGEGDKGVRTEDGGPTVGGDQGLGEERRKRERRRERKKGKSERVEREKKRNGKCGKGGSLRNKVQVCKLGRSCLWLHTRWSTRDGTMRYAAGTSALVLDWTPSALHAAPWGVLYRLGQCLLLLPATSNRIGRNTG